MLCLQACGGPGAVEYDASRGPFDALSRDAERELAWVDALVSEGSLGLARSRLLEIRARWPRNMAVASSLQEVELALELQRLELEADSAVDPRLAQRELARAYRERAIEAPSVLAFLLAARIEEDGIAAERLLEQALDLDPFCAWAHYGIAHLRARAARWAPARESLDRALEIDPGHLRARRLDAALTARAGNGELAAAMLEQWLRVTADLGQITEAERDGARLDLARLWIEAGRISDAERLLRRVGGEATEAVRRTLEAAVHQAEGDPDRALEAARRAEAAAPGDPLPLVQQAILLETWLERPVEARRAWERVVIGLEGREDLLSLVLHLRARIAVERLSPDPNEDGFLEPSG